MCGIVGFLAKTQELQQSLGAHVTPMLDCMGTRGPDSAGFAVFTEPVAADCRRFSVFAYERSFDWQTFQNAFREHVSATANGNGGGDFEFEAIANHGAVVSSIDPGCFKDWLNREYLQLHLLSVGHAIDLYKDEGHPHEIGERFGFANLTGTHAIAHTRMATESAVSPAHAHPFTAGEDFCLVHNGSLSNPYSIRRKLERLGITFETDNDTEAGCRDLEWRLREGDTLEQAIESSFSELDGFFTFLMATADKMVLVRDAFACKPAVAAETDDYVAVASEFRSLAHLPDINQANVFEPMPEQIYSWTV